MYRIYADQLDNRGELFPADRLTLTHALDKECQNLEFNYSDTQFEMPAAQKYVIGDVFVICRGDILAVTRRSPAGVYLVLLKDGSIHIAGSFAR